MTPQKSHSKTDIRINIESLSFFIATASFIVATLSSCSTINSNDVSTRAWIDPHHFMMTRPVDLKSDLLAYKVELMNVGHSPATNVKFAMIHRKFSLEQNKPIQITDIPPVANPPCEDLDSEKYPVSQTVFPGQVVPAYRQERPNPEREGEWHENLVKLVTGTLVETISGFVIYSTNGYRHVSKFCELLYFDTAKADMNFSQCQSGNYAD